jgi:hypothetical protein
MKAGGGMGRKLDAPRLLQLAAAIFNAIKAQAAQDVCKRVTSDWNSGRMVKHNGVSSMETPGGHCLCCGTAKCCAAKELEPTTLPSRLGQGM